MNGIFKNSDPPLHPITKYIQIFISFYFYNLYSPQIAVILLYCHGSLQGC